MEGDGSNWLKAWPSPGNVPRSVRSENSRSALQCRPSVYPAGNGHFSLPAESVRVVNPGKERGNDGCSARDLFPGWQDRFFPLPPLPGALPPTHPSVEDPPPEDDLE
ncbi:hypothetical protein AVEN_101208-1 [Araneus ventricosus]|uniref:Uncharacterized protein n=1 Tax=Araneus ventricosus TaxID=182803 RepID=A0A4Y2K6B8_ARAVE|nr:hypothetical protein AVEN_101208-1 [Araneus ventricosus]